MTKYRLLGSATTNSQGIATINYTGVEAGEINIIASTDSTITGTSLVSETYDLLDCNKYDKGTTTNHNDIWTDGLTSAVTRTSEYSIIQEPSTSNIYVGFPIPSTSVCIEFDVYQVDGTKSDFFYEFRQNSTYLQGGSLNYIQSNVGTWTHVVLTIPSDSGYFTMSDGVITPVQRTMTWDISSNLYFGFWTSGDITEIRFRNLKAYPI